MKARGPYQQRLEMFGGAWFARTFATTANGQPIAGEPDAAEAFVNRGNMLRDQGRYDEALASYQQAIALEPRHADAFFNRGNALWRLGRAEQALESYNSVISLRPDHADAHYNRGVALMDLKRHGEALASFDSVIALRPSYVQALNNRGNALQVLKRFEEALASYNRAIALKPDYADAYYNRGIVLLAAKRFEEARVSFDQTIALTPDCAEAANNRGNALAELKRIDEALASFDQAIALKPNYAEALHNQGSALRALDRFEEALASHDRAIAIKPDYADAFLGRGIALQKLGRFNEALASFDRAIVLKPNYAEAFQNRGGALRALDRFEEALASLERAIAIKPDYADAFFDRGISLQQLGRFDEALASFDKAIALKPDVTEAFINRGNALQELRQFDEALASYEQAIALKPDGAEAYYDRALALAQLERFDEALASYDKAIALKPDYAEAFNNRGHLLKDEGRQAEALLSFEHALALKPDYADAKLALCMAQLPILYEDEAEIAARRAAYRQSLEALRDDVERRKTPDEWAKVVGSTQPFLLPYQGYNDRDLANLYGSLMCRIMAERYPPAAIAPPPRSDERIRLGIVSGFFWHHSVWKIPVRGWLSQIDRSRFQIFGYYTGVKEDTATSEAASLCDRFVRGPLSTESWRDVILNDAPHVLIHPDIGMNAVSARLAAQRLAAVQCNSWGHPDTSGFPTIDYYLSSELMEPPDGQDHYTERLVSLPNLSIYYEPPERQPVPLDRAELGLRPNATVFWCGQSLFKYLPQFDQVFPLIAREVGDCQFAFIQYQQGTHLNQQFFRRLERAFASAGLRAADYCVVLPRLKPSRFLAAIGQCDIVLDSIGWSGCNSTLEGLHYDLPIVTMKGSLMRGRHTSAILERIDVEETITESVGSYVAAAVRLARDLPWRAAVQDKISRNKHRLYRDATCVSALEEFLESVVRRAV